MSEDEAGIMMLSNKHEQLLRSSVHRTKNVALEEYIREVTCVIAGDSCDSIRTYILNTPGLNAFMMPNGAMFIQSGLLLRISSESELAFVIAHEIVHYKNKHSLFRTRERRKTQKYVSVLGAASIGSEILVSSIAGAYYSSFSRSQEEEADIEALRMIENSNYSKSGGFSIWDNFIKEHPELDAKKTTLFGSHPMPAARREYLLSQIDDQIIPEFNQSNIFNLIQSERINFLKAELKVLNPKRFKRLLTNQKKISGIDNGTFYYLLGESWANNAKNYDRDSESYSESVFESLHFYNLAVESEDKLPSYIYRNWAKLSEGVEEYCLAKKGYQMYLDSTETTWDRKYIKGKIEDLKALPITC